MKRTILVIAILLALVAGGLSRGAEATPVIIGHCGEPFTAVVYCEYETDPRSDLKYAVWCLCYNFISGAYYID